MLKVYSVSHYVSIDGCKWYSVGRYGQTMFDDSESKEIIIDNGSFDEWYKYLQANSLPGIYSRKTFFTKKPCIVTHEWSYDSYAKYTNFNTLVYKTVYKELKNASLAHVMKNFPADKCIQYLKERGCPMNF